MCDKTKVNAAICALVDAVAGLVDALDPALRSMGAKMIFWMTQKICNAGECCKPPECPPLCPPPPSTCPPS
jgi:hypothetical protein